MTRDRLAPNIVVRPVRGDGGTPKRGEPLFTIFVDRRSSSGFPPGIHKSQCHLDGARHLRPTDVSPERAYIDLDRATPSLVASRMMAPRSMASIALCGAIN